MALTELEKLFNQTGDWMRYAINAWVVYTTGDAMMLASQIRGLSGMQAANIIVSEMSIHYSGYLPKWAWEWLAQRTPPGGIKPTF